METKDIVNIIKGITVIFIFVNCLYIYELYNMNQMKQNLNKTQEIIKDINSTKNDFENLEKVIDEIQLSITELNNIELYQNNLNEQISNLNENIKICETENKMQKPTKQEIVDFLDNEFDFNIWFDDLSYNCVDYSNLMINELNKKNIFSCVGYIETEMNAHSIVVVDTLDGILYIESQPADQRFYPKITRGFNYCEYQGWQHTECSIRKFSNCFEGRVV